MTLPAVLSLLYAPAELWFVQWAVSLSSRLQYSRAMHIASSDAYCSRSVRPYTGSGSGRPVTPAARERSVLVQQAPREFGISNAVWADDLGLCTLLNSCWLAVAPSDAEFEADAPKVRDRCLL